MYLVDSSVWFALAVDLHVHHSIAATWFGTVNTPRAVCFCRSTQLSFLRLLTTTASFSRYGSPALTNDRAWGVYNAFLADERVHFVSSEPASLASRWKLFAGRDTPSPNVWMDAYLAAFAWAGGYQLVTLDRGFRQFEGLDLLLLDASSA